MIILFCITCMNNDLLYQLALTMIPNVGEVHAKALALHFGSAEAVFKTPLHQLEMMDGIGTVRAKSIKKFHDFSSCEAEISFIEKYKIQAFFITDDDYPQRLLNCYDSPTLLFYRGNSALNKKNIISIVGTRNNTEYGRELCQQFIEDLKAENIIIVSGLAYGIDSIAHKAAVKNKIATVAVMAHGMDRIYPPANKQLAKQITENGGLLTEFRIGSNPDRQNFPKRNRIVAGMADAVVVIESGIKGGSLITAELGNSYNRDVFAFPGRVSDSRSEGCNYLVKNNKASLITGAKDFLEQMNWVPIQDKNKKKQRELFVELSADEKKLTEVLQEKEQVAIDELYAKTGLSSSSVAAALLMLEMQGLVTSLPGKMYKLT